MKCNPFSFGNNRDPLVMDESTLELLEEFTCSICMEYFIDATALECGHVFCQRCIHEWRRKHRKLLKLPRRHYNCICPLCNKIWTSESKVFPIDRFLDRVGEKYPEIMASRMETKKLRMTRKKKSGAAASSAAASSAAASSATIATPIAAAINTPGPATSTSAPVPSSTSVSCTNDAPPRSESTEESPQASTSGLRIPTPQNIFTTISQYFARCIDVLQLI